MPAPSCGVERALKDGLGERPSLQDHLARLKQRVVPAAQPDDVTLESLRPRAVVLPNEPGRVWRIEECYDLNTRVGQAPLAAALSVTPKHLAELTHDDTFLGVQTNKLLFFDTETTGLMGGAGTVPFLLGMAYFEAGHLKVEQLMLQQLGHESSMLKRLLHKVQEADAIVTFNGKSFDWPLVRARAIMARLGDPGRPKHIDLLHVCRRLMPTLGSHRLCHVERHMLGIVRHDDLPGHQVPERFFAYLRGARPDTLLPIVAHNAQDVVSMPAILAALAERLDVCQRAHLKGDEATARRLAKVALVERLAIAMLHLHAHRYQAAAQLAQTVVYLADASLALQAGIVAARAHTRLGKIDVAVRLLERALLTADGPDKAMAHLILAKLYEHRLNDWPRALRHAKRSMPAEDLPHMQRRVSRLMARLAKTHVSARS